MAEKKSKSPLPMDVSSLLGSHRGTVPHAAGSGSHSPGGSTPARDGAPRLEGALGASAPPEEASSSPQGLPEAGEGQIPATAEASAPASGPTAAGESLPEAPGMLRTTSAPRKPAQNLSQRRVLISVLMDSLGTGDVKGPVSSQERKVYSVPLSLPASIHGPLTEVAGDQRQVGETLREALDDLIQQCQFQATLVTYTHSLKRSYEAFVEVRKAARKLGGGGMRPVTVNLTEDAGQGIVTLSRDLETTPVRLLETLAYQLALLAPSMKP